jgi:hypothetical protein
MRHIQFSVAQLLALTAFVAVVAAVLGQLDLPPILRLVLIWGYLVYLGGWLAVRGPEVIGGLNDVQRRRLALRDSRRALAREIEAKREALKQKTESGDAPAKAIDRVV